MGRKHYDDGKPGLGDKLAVLSILLVSVVACLYTIWEVRVRGASLDSYIGGLAFFVSGYALYQSTRAQMHSKEHEILTELRRIRKALMTEQHD